MVVHKKTFEKYPKYLGLLLRFKDVLRQINLTERTLDGRKYRVIGKLVTYMIGKTNTYIFKLKKKN